MPKANLQSIYLLCRLGHLCRRRPWGLPSGEPQQSAAVPSPTLKRPEIAHVSRMVPITVAPAQQFFSKSRKSRCSTQHCHSLLCSETVMLQRHESHETHEMQSRIPREARLLLRPSKAARCEQLRHHLEHDFSEDRRSKDSALAALESARFVLAAGEQSWELSKGKMSRPALENYKLQVHALSRPFLSDGSGSGY